MRKEHTSTSFIERSEGVIKISRFLAIAAEKYRSEGIPVGNDGRIDMKAYEALYPHIQQDCAKVRDWQETWAARQASSPGIHEPTEGIENRGESLEMLVVAIFQKKFGDRFVVVRSSLFDDITHKVDTIVLDRETGALLCALDEIGKMSGQSYDAKLASIKGRNLGGGAALKYGLAMKADGDKKKIVKAPAKNLPIFHIALDDKHIEQGLEAFNPSPGVCSNVEENLFAYFIATINLQVAALGLDGQRLDPDLKKRLLTFKAILDPLAKGMPHPE